MLIKIKLKIQQTIWLCYIQIILKTVYCFRDFPAEWLEVLFGIVELSLDVILNQTCKKNEESQNGYHVNGSKELDSRIVEGLLSCEEQRKCFAKVQKDILRRI